MEYEKPTAEFIAFEGSDAISTSAVHLPIIPIGQGFDGDETEYCIPE